MIRHKFLLTALACAAFQISWAGASLVPGAETNAQDTARYVFYFIGDGMGMGPVMSAQNYYRIVKNEQAPLEMMQMPVVGWCQTWSASTPVTDSAAAGTALSTGHKTRNGMLGMDADTVSVPSIARSFHDAGRGVAVITSVAPDDATPGAFYAHVPKRSMYYEIGTQMADCGYGFIAGAGLRGLKDKKGADTDLLQRFADAGVSIFYGPDDLPSAPLEGRALLLNPADTPNYNIGYTIDSIGGNSFTLPQFTALGIEYMERNHPDGFFMMVEGGNIDHALHANDGGAAIKEILNFDQALGLARDFAARHPGETLIVVTADHDTGGMALGNTVVRYDYHPGLFDAQRVSKEAFSDYCRELAALPDGSDYDWDAMKAYLTDKLGFFTVVPVSEDDEAELHKLFDDTFLARNTTDQETLYASFNAFAVAVFRHLNNQAGVGFTTTSHSGNPVPVFAEGVGQEYFKGFNNNNELPGHILRSAGLEYQK